MAVTASNLTAGFQNTVSVTSQATGSITPTANALVLAAVTSRTNISTNPNQPTATGNGLTWVVVNSIVWDTTSTSRKRTTVFRAMGASPSTGAVTFDFGGQTQTDVIWSVDQFIGIDTSGTNGSGAIVQSATNKDESITTNSLTVTLGAFSSTSNATYGNIVSDDTATSAVGSGFTQLAAQSGNLQMISEWKSTNDTSVDASFTTNSMLGGIAIEIRAEVIMFDSASNSGYQATASTYNWAHVASTGNNRYLIVGVSMLSVAGATVTGITYNSIAMTFLGAISSVSGAVRAELWGLVAPSTGSNSIAVTLSASLISAACAISFTGVHQTSPTEGFNSATATNVGAADATVNVTTVATNDWVVDQVATTDTAITVGALQTQRSNVTGAGGSGADSTEPATTAGAYTMSWTNVGALETWSIGAIALRDVNASTIGGVKSLAALGVG